MPNTHIPFKSTGYFSQLILDYIDRKDSVKHLYENFPDMGGFKKQIQQKRSEFSKDSREVLAKSLLHQYSNTNTSNVTIENIESLREPNTFTIVTGHQLNLFTGPLYFLYKIVSTINLCKQLKEEFPKENFIPVYWMATEDHDFQEINHFFIEDNKISWDVESTGPVGRKKTNNFEAVFNEFSNYLGGKKTSDQLKKLFIESYEKHESLTEAMRFLVNELFGLYGLVIIDGDDVSLKEQFIPFVEKELKEKYAIGAIENTNSFLLENYKVQVNPREINLFYIENDLRERIVFENNTYKINNTTIEFTVEEILQELKLSPEKFSPNVIMRPLYQEVVLPNLCYIGGGGELAYWLQLKELFTASKISFPILLLRNSVLLASEKQGRKIKNLNLEYQNLFLKQSDLLTKVVRECCQIDLDLLKQKELLKKIFEDLKPIAETTDPSFKGALAAQEKKQLKGLHNLEKRLLKAEKRKHSDVTNRVVEIQNTLFPRKGLQERNVNFAGFYEEYGEDLIPTLLKELDPLELSFSVLEL